MNSLSNDEVIEHRQKMTYGDQGNKTNDKIDDLFWVGQKSSIQSPSLEVLLSSSG